MVSNPESQRFSQREGLPESLQDVVKRNYVQFANEVASRARAKNTTLTVGLCGAQGSGKSTLAQVLGGSLREQGLTSAILSLDDLYLTRREREMLAERVHPLLLTRGVPGTHDVELGLRVLKSLTTEGTAALPRFDKARDDRCHVDEWLQIATPVDVVIFEGWCVGARPEPPAALNTPINTLERDRDPGGIWRRYVNNMLATRYAPLFAPIGLLVLLQAPSFEVVYEWRREQEDKLRERVSASGELGTRLMDDSALRTFIAHYERLTRHILEDLPGRADVVFKLDEERRPTRVR